MESFLHKFVVLDKSSTIGEPMYVIPIIYELNTSTYIYITSSPLRWIEKKTVFSHSSECARKNEIKSIGSKFTVYQNCMAKG